MNMLMVVNLLIRKVFIHVHTLIIIDLHFKISQTSNNTCTESSNSLINMHTLDSNVLVPWSHYSPVSCSTLLIYNVIVSLSFCAFKNKGITSLLILINGTNNDFLYIFKKSMWPVFCLIIWLSIWISKFIGTTTSLSVAVFW